MQIENTNCSGIQIIKSLSNIHNYEEKIIFIVYAKLDLCNIIIGRITARNGGQP